jgi:PadR family transcriptional regulator, regulatory protein PadR
MPSIHGDHLRGHLETLILATLEKSPAHGLEILQRLELRGCGMLKLKEGSLYPALYRLESAGQVKAEWESAAHGRRGARRRIYCLTPKGTRRLKEARGEFEQFVTVITSILGLSPQ